MTNLFDRIKQPRQIDRAKISQLQKRSGLARDVSGPFIYRLEIDGSCNPNPNGRMGMGVSCTLLEEGMSKKLSDLSKRVPAAAGNSNNLAEYLALREALIMIASLGSGVRVLINTDSKMLADQMNGRKGIRSGSYVKAALGCAELLQSLPFVRIKWVPREFNQTSDALSKETGEFQPEWLRSRQELRRMQRSFRP